MESERKVAFEMPTAPPLHHNHYPPPQPFHNHPQMQYGFQYTPPPPPPPYTTNSPSPPPSYTTNSPPPPPPPQPYTTNPPPPPPQPYTTNPPPPPPPPYYPQPISYPHPSPISPPPPVQVPAGVNYGLYPNLNQLQENQGSLSTTFTPGPLPTRKAPPLPPPPPAILPQSPSQSRSLAGLKEGECPAGHVVQWKGGEGLQLFFIQREGHVVAPKNPLVMTVYKKICVEGGAEGVIEVHGCWRLRLTPSHTPVLHTVDSYIFLDSSTNPSRAVMIQMPSQMTKRMSADLLDLLTQLTDLRKEEGGVIGKVTTGVATVYDDLTHKLNSVVKGTVPNAHKNTKWIRKNTGSLVRIGGSLVAKGIHIVADHIPSNEKSQEEESAVHTDLLTQLKVCKKSLDENTVVYID